MWASESQHKGCDNLFQDLMDQKMMRLVGEVSGGKCKQYSLFIIKGFFVVEPEENSAV